MNKRVLKTVVSSALCLSMILSSTACSESTGETTNNEPEVTTNAEYAPLQEHVKELAAKVDPTIKVEKKIRWLSHWPIDETDAPSELFKSVYGIPEEGDQSYKRC